MKTGTPAPIPPSSGSKSELSQTPRRSLATWAVSAQCAVDGAWPSVAAVPQRHAMTAAGHPFPDRKPSHGSWDDFFLEHKTGLRGLLPATRNSIGAGARNAVVHVPLRDHNSNTGIRRLEAD